MEYSLQTYFDIGVTFGLGDDVFAERDVNAPNILNIGIRNPLGLGLQYRIDEKNPEIVTNWRQRARSKVDDPEMDLGYDDSVRDGSIDADHFESFKQELRDLIEVHPIALCELTIYAIGVVFMRLDFANGIPVHLLRGTGHCFEYAAYLEPVSLELLNAAKEATNTALVRRPRRSWRRNADTGIQDLSKRPEAEIQTDEGGYKESRLFQAGFTHVAMCVDKGDDVEDIKRRIQPVKGGTSEPDSETLFFEYHGKIHFNWAACVLEPKSFDDNETPTRQIQRMLVCIQIAHTFQGACDAFVNLFFNETLHQADGFIKGKRGGRNHVELNRLRTLALAVVSLTDFAPVAAAEEDQAYFNAYSERARIVAKHELILKRCEILLNVQQAEADEEEDRRELHLNIIVLSLTAFTLLSVLADTYGFLRGEEQWFKDAFYREEILSVIIATLVVTVFLLAKSLRGRNKKG